MSLFRSERRGSFDTNNLAELLASARGGRAAAGVRVDEDTSMRLSSVWACVRLLADQISATPLHAYRDRDGLAEQVRPPQLLVRPSGLVDRVEWVQQVMVSLLLWGNAIGVVVARDGAGWPTQIELVPPSKVDIDQPRPGQSAVYRFDSKVLPADDVWHVRGRSMPGSVVGLSPIAYARESVGTGLAAGKFGAEFFGDGAHPTGVLSTDAPIDAVMAQAVKDRFMAALGRGREPAVLGAGLSWSPIQVNPTDSQFLDTIRASASEVCQFFGVFPEMIGLASSGSSLTYANREQRAVDHLSFTYDPWLVKLERALTDVLPRGQFARFNRDYLLRTDTKSRYDAHEVGLRAKFLTVNEVRALEDLPPVPGGDVVAPAEPESIRVLR